MCYNSCIMEQISNNLDNKQDQPSSQNNKKLKLIKKDFLWKIPLAIFLVSILLLGGYLGFRLFSIFKKIITENLSGSAPALLGKILPQKLKGEGDGRINILVLGIPGGEYPGAELTDSIIVVSVEPNGRGVALLSIPRDLWVKVPGHGFHKINEAHAIGEQNHYPGGGPQLAKETVQQLLDLPIHYYVRVDFVGFKKLIDAIGGVEVTVEKDLKDYWYPSSGGGRETFYLKKGTYIMDGELALKYARSRQSTSDFDRARRQQQILVAAKEKILKEKIYLDVKKIEEILKIVGDHVKTDFQIWEIKKMAEIGEKIDSNKIFMHVLDNSADGILVSSYKNGAYVLLPKNNDYSKIAAFAHEIFDDIYVKEENARIEILNGTYYSKRATQLAEFLKSYGYNIVNVGFADTRNIKKTVIYDYTNGKKPYTVNYLQKRLKAEVIKKKAEKPDIDIQIIIGLDYKGYFEY